jgi:phosphoribosylformylglycinamidine cyclo-ligase
MKEDRLNTYIPEFSRTIGEELLEPTRIYVKSLKKLVKSVKVKGIANITGGGFYENIPRMLPDGVFARVEKSAMEVPPVFSFIERIGRIPERDMYNTFNMGVSLVIAVDKKHADTALGVLRESGEKCEVLGEVLSGDGGVTIC